MTDVFQFLLLNDSASGVPDYRRAPADCQTQFPGAAGWRVVEYQNTRNKPSNIPKIMPKLV